MRELQLTLNLGKPLTSLDVLNAARKALGDEIRSNAVTICAAVAEQNQRQQRMRELDALIAALTPQLLWPPTPGAAWVDVPVDHADTLTITRVTPEGKTDWKIMGTNEA